jgi:hypothetical protein
MAPPQQGHDAGSGSITTSIRGRCAGSDLPLARLGPRGRRSFLRRRLLLRARNLAFFERELQLVLDRVAPNAVRIALAATVG